MAGLFSALFLRRRGWDVALYERSPVPLTGRGAGIMTHPELHRALAALGLDTSRDFGVAIEERVALDAAGAVVAPQAAPADLHLLEPAVRAAGRRAGGRVGRGAYQLGKDLVRVTQDGDGVAAHFADGTSAAGDILVGADGLRSAVRAQYLPRVAAAVRRLRGLARPSRRAAAAAAALGQELFGQFSFCLPPGEQFLGYPVAGPGNDLRPGHRSWNVVWYRPADEATELPRLLTDATGRTHEVSIPPPLIAPAVIAEMRTAAERLLPPPLRAAVALIAQPFLQPVYDLESPALAFGRVALAGDAAFVVRPARRRRRGEGGGRCGGAGRVPRCGAHASRPDCAPTRPDACPRAAVRRPGAPARLLSATPLRQRGGARACHGPCRARAGAGGNGGAGFLEIRQRHAAASPRTRKRDSHYI